ncbi:MAG: hypothetical protein HRT37_25740 [Alteromonadaceae bacterium]|nr:hypothetical protein [Alteromonadaceae bacterium]
MIKRALKIVLGIICIYIAVVIIFSDEINLGWGYEIRGWSTDKYYNRIHIVRHDKMVIKPAIKDYQVINNYLVAFSIPTMEVKCQHNPMLIYIDKPVYHILELENTKVMSFDNKQVFEEKLKVLSLFKDVVLDYNILSRFFINEYARFDNKKEYSDCMKRLDLVGTRVIKYR